MMRRLMGIAAGMALLAGCANVRHGAQDTSAVADAATEQQLARELAQARRALAARKWPQAVAHAEAAVAVRGVDADARAMLATAYLRAGRFASAEQAFSDTLALRGDDGRAALYLALTQVALGKWDEAQAGLVRHAALIPVADRGLIMALAGQPREGAALLMAALRRPDADARMRQNLALALGLAGEWRDAHLVAGVDLDPQATNRRIMEWMSFAQPRSASDQVAALLRIVPAADPGQPAALALVRAPAAPAVAEAPVDAFMPGAPGEEAVAVAPPPSDGGLPQGQAVAQISTPRPPAPGKWFVQVGAYDSAAVARAGWSRIRRRMPELAGHVPSAIRPVRGTSRFYRLSIGGFALTDAVALCRSMRGQGSTCYVRPPEGDRPTRWHRPATPVRLAAR